MSCTRVCKIAVLLVAAVLGASTSKGAIQDGAKTKESVDQRLALGEIVKREITEGESHVYRVNLTAGQFFQAVVDQQGVDVVVQVLDPDGKLLVEIDGPTGPEGIESPALIADNPGTYKLIIKSPLRNSYPAGRYETRITDLRSATARDQTLILAFKSLVEGKRLRSQIPVEARRRAIDELEKSIQLFRDLGERQRETLALHYLHTTLANLGDSRRALELNLQLINAWRALGNRWGEAQALSGLGAGYRNLGELQKALDYFRQAERAWRAIGDLRSESVTLNNMAAVYRDLGERGRALEIFEQLLPKWRALGDKVFEAINLNFIGEVFAEKGETGKALDYYLMALSISRAAKDKYSQANALYGIAELYHDLGEAQKALEFYDQALQIDRSIANRSGEAYLLLGMGKIYAETGETQKAFDFYNQALFIRREIESKTGEAATLYEIAHLQTRLGQLTEARQQIEAALAIVESLRTTITSDDLRTTYFATVHQYYELYIDLLLQLHQRSPEKGYDGEALRASERGRSRTLLETLIEARTDIRKGVDPVLLERERELQRQLNRQADRLARVPADKRSEAQVTDIKKSIRELTVERDLMEEKIRQQSPRYAALTRPVPLALSEIQREVLDKDTLLLEYALGTDRSYVWVVTQDSIRSYELPKRVEVEKAARRVYEMLIERNRTKAGETVEQQRSRLAQAEAQWPEAAESLSRMVLGPVAGQLGKKRLLIVADGGLQYIPFAALPVPTNLESGVRSPESNSRLPLIVEHEIVTLPSASVLAAQRSELKNRKPAAHAIAVFADPVFETDDERIVAGARKREQRDPKIVAAVVRPSISSAQRTEAEEGFNITRLPFTRREAETILAIIPAGEGMKAVDFRASRETAMSPELSGYRILHFATHGLLNDENPALSGIVLSLVDERGQPRDGFLRLNEIYNLDLPAELVVLSACQSGLGKEIKGEGLIGLTRGFMYAGAARVVASLWKVDDVATAELMKRFYQRMLKDKLSAASALRTAQVEMWREKRWHSPYYWAAFELQGEWK